MVSREDNDLLCRVGPGTPMGDVMRHYWIPAARSDELPAADGAPLRVRLLGENLIAFRVTSGKVGLIANACPHRGASLYYGRNEQEGLRCVYHGWKFDVAGSCVDMPSEPPGSTFKDRVEAVTYPCVERGGIIWTYMGRRDPLPPLPDLEANMHPESSVVTILRHCNYLQALEGDLDTVHFGFLHAGHLTLEDAYEGTFLHHLIKERSTRFVVTDTDFGTCYGAYREVGDEDYYWRIGNFLFPFYTQVPGGALALNRGVRAWVPLDDEHTMSFTMSAPPVGGITANPERRVRAAEAGSGPKRVFGVVEILPDTTDWYGRSRPKAEAANDYLLDRDSMKNGDSYTGLPGLVVEDQAVTESMGSICDRTQEHLGTSDSMIIRTRKRLLQAVDALRTQGERPPGADDPTVYRQRAGGVLLPRSVDWLEGTKELRKAFVDHPEELVLETIGEPKRD